MATSTSEEKLDNFTREMQRKFLKLKITDGLVHNYLGMTLDFTEPGACDISMHKYVQDILKDTLTVGIIYKRPGVATIEGWTD